MKEHGLLLSDPMVRARAAMHKWQTRRLITRYNSEIEMPGRGSRMPFAGTSWSDLAFHEATRGTHRIHNQYYGQHLTVPLYWKEKKELEHRIYPRILPGHKIWWRECHKVMHTDDLKYYPELNDGRPIDPGTEEEQQHEEYPIRIPIYRATDPPIDLVLEDDDGDEKPVGWTPGIHMRRQWARFVDTVVHVRPERLSEIIEADAIAEGIRQVNGRWIADPERDHWDLTVQLQGATARECYFNLMKKLHGEDILEKDPWLWVIEFVPTPAKSDI